MKDDFQEFRTEALVRLKTIELKIDHANEDRNEIKKDLEDYRIYMDTELGKLDNKCIYIEREMPNASTYKFIAVTVSIIITAAVGIIIAGFR